MPMQSVTIVIEGVVNLVCYLSLFDHATTHFWEYLPTSPTPSSSYSRLVTKWPSDVTIPPVFNRDVGQFGRLEVTDDNKFTLALRNATAADAGLYRCGMSFLSGSDEVDSMLTNLTVIEPIILTSTPTMAFDTSSAPPSSSEAGASVIAWVIPIVIITLACVGVLIYCLWSNKRTGSSQSCLRYKKVNSDDHGEGHDESPSQNARNQQSIDCEQPADRTNGNDSTPKVSPKPSEPNDEHDFGQPADNTDGNTQKDDLRPYEPQKELGDDQNEESIRKDTDSFVRMLRRNFELNSPGDWIETKREALKEFIQIIANHLNLQNGSSVIKYEPFENTKGKGESEDVSKFAKYAGSLFFQIGLIDDEMASMLRKKFFEDAGNFGSNDVRSGSWVTCPGFKELLEWELKKLDKNRCKSAVKKISAYIMQLQREKRRAESSPGGSYSVEQTPTLTDPTSNRGKSQLELKRERFQRTDSSVNDYALDITRDIEKLKKSEKEKELLQLKVLVDFMYADSRSTDHDERKEHGSTVVTVTNEFKQELTRTLKKDETRQLQLKRETLNICLKIVQSSELEDSDYWYTPAEGSREGQDRSYVTPFVEYTSELYCQIRRISEDGARCLLNFVSSKGESNTDVISSTLKESIREKGTSVSFSSFETLLRDEFQRMNGDRTLHVFAEISRYMADEGKNQQTTRSSKRKVLERCHAIDEDSIIQKSRLFLEKFSERWKQVYQLKILTEIVYANTSNGQASEASGNPKTEAKGGKATKTAENPEADGKPSIAGISGEISTPSSDN